jgi:hypothetical protein
MKTLDLNFYSDPSHGWLEVKRADLIALGIEDDISGFSYQKGAKVYLEEDNDMSRFMDAATAAGWTIKTAEFHNDADLFIRLYNRYESTAAARQSIAAFYDNNPNLTLADLSRFTGKSVPALKQFLLERK